MMVAYIGENGVSGNLLERLNQIDNDKTRISEDKTRCTDEKSTIQDKIPEFNKSQLKSI
jgi:hypothetical protein